MNTDYNTPAIGIIGILGTLTLENINTTVAILVGLASLVWILIKIFKELQ